MTEVDNEFLYEMDELMNEGRFQEVIDRISELDEDEMTNELYIMLAHSLSQCAKYHDALNTLENIEEDTADDDMGYHLEKAGALFGLHHYTSAVREAKVCLEIDDTCVEPWLILCLIYQETGNEAQFNYASERAREIDEEAWDNIFGDKISELELYEDDELNIVLDFISKHFGVPVKMFRYQDENGQSQPHPINCLLIPPDEQNDFFKIVSTGIGAYRGIDKNRNDIVHRIEMAAFLPSELSVEEIENKYAWIARIMRQFGEMIQLEGSWLDAGHTVAYGDVLDSSVSYNGVIFNDVFVDTPEREKCMLPCGEEVHFLRFIPLYEEEMIFKIENGYPALFRKLEQLPPEQIDVIIPDRPDTCLDSKVKKWSLPRSSMETLIDWNGPDGCYATDRITVDGCRVGFMYRQKPDNKLDSGWRFLAGDESEDYMNDINNMDIFCLNTICNYDPDIIEHLESPVGSVFYRDADGSFKMAGHMF